jgi:hypothetical protein
LFHREKSASTFPVRDASGDGLAAVELCSLPAAIGVVDDAAAAPMRIDTPMKIARFFVTARPSRAWNPAWIVAARGRRPAHRTLGRS